MGQGQEVEAVMVVEVVAMEEEGEDTDLLIEIDRMLILF